MATELEAINILLVGRGVTPVSDVDSGHPDAKAARSLLAQHKRAVCAVKWFFNTERDVDLTPNVDEYILVPSGVISLDVDQNYIIMQGKLYSMTERTNKFQETVEGLTLIYNREWEDLPNQAFDYICALAKEEFIRPLESQQMTAQAETDIARLKAVLDIAEYRFNDPGVETSNPLMLKWRQEMLIR